MRLSGMWWILQIKEDVIHRRRRPRWITPSEICRILHILRKTSSLVPLFQNESKCETFHMKMSSARSFIFMQIKVIFIRMVSHLDSLWNRGTRELGNGLLGKACWQRTNIQSVSKTRFSDFGPVNALDRFGTTQDFFATVRLLPVQDQWAPASYN